MDNLDDSVDCVAAGGGRRGINLPVACYRGDSVDFQPAQRSARNDFLKGMRHYRQPDSSDH